MPSAFWQAACLSSAAPAQVSASGALLQQMEQASQTLNYEFAYINVSRLGMESLRYRHAVIDDRVYAQVLQMDGPRREVIQRGNDISYFEPALSLSRYRATTLWMRYRPLFMLILASWDTPYDFITVGRSRIADQMCAT